MQQNTGSVLSPLAQRSGVSYALRIYFCPAYRQTCFYTNYCRPVSYATKHRGVSFHRPPGRRAASRNTPATATIRYLAGIDLSLLHLAELHVDTAAVVERLHQVRCRHVAGNLETTSQGKAKNICGTQFQQQLEEDTTHTPGGGLVNLGMSPHSRNAVRGPPCLLRRCSPNTCRTSLLLALAAFAPVVGFIIFFHKMFFFLAQICQDSGLRPRFLLS